MRDIFEPLGWAVRTVHKDNGIDFDIEIFVNFKSTGVFFKVQLKSSGRTRYSAEGFISQQLKVPNAHYLCREVRLPVVLLHADVERKRTFWCAPQLMIPELQRMLAEKDRESISLRIPAANELPLTVNELVETITQVEQVLASRLIISTPARVFVDSISQHVDEDEFARELQDLTRKVQDRADFIKVNQAHELFQSRRYTEAIDKARSVFNNCEASVSFRFAALLTIENAELASAMVSQAPQDSYATIHLKTSRQLLELTRKGPQHLKLQAMIAREAAKLAQLTHRYHGVLLNWVTHRTGTNTMWKAQLLFEKTALYRQILFKYNQCIRLANYSAQMRVRNGIQEALVRIVDAISPWILNLRGEGLNELADQYSASALQICKLAASVALHDGNDEGLFMAAAKALTTKRATTGEAVDFALATIAQIKDESTKQKTQELFDSIIRMYEGGRKVEGPLKTTYRQIYENMATALGVDLNDSDDPTSRLVQIGIADLDPSRILANCEHIFVTFGVRGIVAERLNMPTAGHKILHCNLHEYAIQGLSLDGAYAQFKESFCDRCGDCSPRPSSWKYSEEWQEKENKRHVEYMKRFARRTGTPQLPGLK